MYNIIENSKVGYGVKKIVAELKEDLNKINLNSYASGSSAYVLEDSKTYILKPNKQWVLNSAESSKTGGNSSSSSDSSSSGSSDSSQDEYTIVDGGSAAG